MKIFIFYNFKNLCILHAHDGHLFVMWMTLIAMKTLILTCQISSNITLDNVTKAITFVLVMGQNTRKPVIWVSDQVGHKSVCTVTDESMDCTI